jgi:HemX protein
MDLLKIIAGSFAIFFYLLSFVGYYTILVREDSHKNRRLRLLGAGLLFHAGLLILIAYEQSSLPLHSPGEGLLSGVFIMSFGYWLLSGREETERLGIFALGPVFAGMVTGMILLADDYSLRVPMNYYFAIHIVFSLVAYVSLTVAMVLSFMYALQHSRLQNKQFDRLFKLMPSIQILERYSELWVWVGSGMLSASFISGILWDATETRSANWMPLAVLTVLGMFVALLHRWGVLRSLQWAFSVAFLFFSLIIINVLSLHGY